MIFYGTKIISDLALHCAYSRNSSPRNSVKLLSANESKFENLLKHNLLHLILSNYELNNFRWQDGLYAKAFDGEVKNKLWIFGSRETVQFSWIGHTREIYYKIGEKGDIKLLTYLFVHSFLPFYFSMENLYHMFHGASVMIGRKPVLFLAPSKGGKSTLNNYFVEKGHSLISDDKVATYMQNGNLYLYGSHPCRRLERVEETLGIETKNYIPGPLRIDTIYVLKKNEENKDIVIKKAKFFEKTQEIFQAYLYKFPHLRKERTAFISKIIDNIKVCRIRRPWGKEYLEDTYRAICYHVKMLQDKKQ